MFKRWRIGGLEFKNSNSTWNSTDCFEDTDLKFERYSTNAFILFVSSGWRISI